MTANLQVLTYQRSFPSETWRRLKEDPDLMERVIRDSIRQEIADAIASDKLSTFVINEPGEGGPGLNENLALVRATVAVASKEEASAMALALAEAEERGFRAAIDAITGNLEDFVPRLGPTAWARGALNALIDKVSTQRRHSASADWLPLRSLRWAVGEEIEYLFLNGTVANTPRLCLVRDQPLPGAATDSVGDTVEAVDQLDAIAWRVRGRAPYRERAA